VLNSEKVRSEAEDIKSIQPAGTQKQARKKIFKQIEVSEILETTAKHQFGNFLQTLEVGQKQFFTPKTKNIFVSNKNAKKTRAP
jgi:hypothetical protein